MHILMIAPQPFFQPRGTPFSVLGRLRALSHLGHTVDLLTYPLGQPVAIPGVTILRSPSLPLIQNVPVGPSWTKLFLDMPLFAKAVRLLQQHPYDLLHTHEEAGFMGVLLSKYFRIPHLYDMHSSLPEQLKNFRYFHAPVFINLFSWLEQRVLNTCDALITICPALAQHVQQINSRVPHVMIENVSSETVWQDLSDEDIEKLKFQHGLFDEKKIILYTGTFEPYQGLDLFIASAAYVLHQRRDVLFLLVGGQTEQVQQYQHQVSLQGLSSHFRFTGIRPAHEMQDFLQLAHVLISPRTHGTNTPLKIYDYLQSGKPIIATKLPMHTQVLNPGIAVLTEAEPEALAQGILTVLNQPLVGRQLGQQAQQFFNDSYSYQTFLQKTDQIIRMALG